MTQNVLAKDEKYEDKWIALASNNKIVGYGKTINEAISQADKNGVKFPTIIYSPKIDEAFLL